jgi:hypothetical protein
MYGTGQGQGGVMEGLEDSTIQTAIIDTVERLFRKNDLSDYGALEAIRQGVKHHFSKPNATVETAIEGILNILNKRMRKGVELGRFKEALRQGIAHQLKKQGVAEGSEEQVYTVVALDKSYLRDPTTTGLNKPKKLNIKANSIEDVFNRLPTNHWHIISINGVEVEAGNRPKQGVAEGYGMMEERVDSPVARSLVHRIMMQHPQLLSTYGPEMVMTAIDDVADSVGDVEEIGGSDISAWVKQVKQTLASMDDPATMESLEEGDMKDRMWADAERMDLEAFLDRHFHHPEEKEWLVQFWNEINQVDDDDTMPMESSMVRETKSLIAHGINQVLSEGYWEDIGQAVVAFKGKELPLSAKKLEITSNSPHYKLHPEEFKKDVYDQLKDKGLPVAKRPAPGRKIGGLSVTPELLQQVWRKLENVVSNVVPDGDPIDWMAPYIRKMGVDPFHTREILDMAVKRNYDKRSDYSKYLQDMWDAYGEMQGSDYQNPWK